MNTPIETQMNLISEGSKIEGEITFDQTTRVEGILRGTISSKPGSLLILAETSLVEGIVQADTLIIDGFIQGEVHAKNRVVISKTGRVIGSIQTPSLTVEFGAYFEGQCRMQQATSA